MAELALFVVGLGMLGGIGWFAARRGPGPLRRRIARVVFGLAVLVWLTSLGNAGSSDLSAAEQDAAQARASAALVVVVVMAVGLVVTRRRRQRDGTWQATEALKDTSL